MAEPQTKAEYEKRFHENERIDGFGLDTTMHMPCPFCSAADFCIFKILDSEEAMGRGATCKECGRSAKAIYQRGPGSLAFEIVQTGGADAPGWLLPMRRV